MIKWVRNRGALCEACRHYIGYADSDFENNPLSRLQPNKRGPKPKIKRDLARHNIDESNFYYACNAFPDPPGIPVNVLFARPAHLTQLQGDQDLIFEPTRPLLTREVRIWADFTWWAKKYSSASLNGVSMNLNELWKPVAEMGIAIFRNPEPYFDLQKDAYRYLRDYAKKSLSQAHYIALRKIVPAAFDRISKTRRRLRRGSDPLGKVSYSQHRYNVLFNTLFREAYLAAPLQPEEALVLDELQRRYQGILCDRITSKIHGTNTSALCRISIDSLKTEMSLPEMEFALFLLSNGLKSLSKNAIRTRVYRLNQSEPLPT